MEQPKFELYLLPALQVASDGQERATKTYIEEIASKMGLSEIQKQELLPKTNEAIYHNRASWSITYLFKARLLERPKRATYVISKTGLKFLSEHPSKVSVEDLRQFKSFNDFQAVKTSSGDENSNGLRTSTNNSSSTTPEEEINNAEALVKRKTCQEILEQVRKISPSDFESLVVVLLTAMGYGDGTPSSGFTTGGAGDGGIDGVIKQDRLGLDNIYIQAKRYKDGSLVTPHDLRDFVGALRTKASKGVRKGVFITTSDFTKEGKKFVEELSADEKVVLINGEALSELMYDYNVGVTTYKQVSLKKIDLDFFND